MTLRTRMLVAFGVVVLIPLSFLAFGLRQEMTRRLSGEYQIRVNRAVDVISEDLERESAAISERLASLKTALLGDNRFRLAAVAELDSERTYLLEYAGTAMGVTGLSMLQIFDKDGRIISSGHFRNEHGRVIPGLTAALTYPGDGVTLLTTRVPDQEFLSLVRAESLGIGGRTFYLVGGVAVDEAFLARLARDPGIVVSLRYPGGELSSDPTQDSSELAEESAQADAAIAFRDIPLLRIEVDRPLERVDARLQVTQERTPLRALLRSVDSWFLMVAAGTAIGALALAFWLSSRISSPLAALAAKTSVLDLDRLDVRFESGSGEVGTLARVLNDLAARLRASTARIREAERRATVGDVARQVNHDIKNGLIPLRNVIRHLEQVEREEPSSLPSVFGERRHTIDSSIAYLETLATSYQRLSPQASERRNCDMNGLITDVVRAFEGRDEVEFLTHLKPQLPPVLGDPIAFRRILENLTANAAESLQLKPGRVSISTELVERNGNVPVVRIIVADTGKGMAKEEMGKIFNDFYTTKEGGTGLGLSIVRRLVMDANGAIAVESEPGKGTRMIIELPAADRERR